MIVDAAAVQLEPALAAARAGTLSGDLALQVREAAETHGVWLLLAHEAIGQGGREGSRGAVLWRALQEGAVRDTLQQTESRRVIRAMASARIDALILKGAHLSTALYQPSHLRPHVDLDLLVPPAVQSRAREALTALGYQPAVVVQREAVLAQLAFERVEGGVRRVVDLHWRALNPHPFRDLLPFEEVWRRREAVPALGQAAW
ncbi:MAG TPA: nucleotidyltransferase family protein, partial [Myxococcota bacterium]|nr:nucleotidyltransferase family protein [Myxococcota bacterium]